MLQIHDYFQNLTLIVNPRNNRGSQHGLPFKSNYVNLLFQNISNIKGQTQRIKSIILRGGSQVENCVYLRRVSLWVGC